MNSSPVSFSGLYQVRPVCFSVSVFEELNGPGLKSDTCGTALTWRGTSHSGIVFQKKPAPKMAPLSAADRCIPYQRAGSNSLFVYGKSSLMWRERCVGGGVSPWLLLNFFVITVHEGVDNVMQKQPIIKRLRQTFVTFTNNMIIHPNNPPKCRI